MILEITSAADFLVHLLRIQHKHAKKLNDMQLSRFKGSLTTLLTSRYRDHWFPEKPNRGSGFRCIRINRKLDPIISQAATAVGLQPASLKDLFPFELTMWIDPEEVSYRIGENGSICVLYERRHNAPVVVEPPRQSPELFLDPRQYEQVDPMVDYVGVINC